MDSANLTVAERLGCALTIICRRGCYLDYPIASLHVWLLPPAQLSQMSVFLGDDQRLLGYMTWAWFDQETERRWKAGEVNVLHISEWNEGDRLWIIDFVTLPGCTETCVKLAPRVFPEGTVAFALARRNVIGQSTVTKWTRSGGSHRHLHRARGH